MKAKSHARPNPFRVSNAGQARPSVEKRWPVRSCPFASPTTSPDILVSPQYTRSAGKEGSKSGDSPLALHRSNQSPSGHVDLGCRTPVARRYLAHPSLHLGAADPGLAGEGKQDRQGGRVRADNGLVSGASLDTAGLDPVAELERCPASTTHAQPPSGPSRPGFVCRFDSL